MKLRVVLTLAALFVALEALFFASDANATLTSSEKAQVKDHFAGGRLENVGRVRSLVARTDLTAEESTAVMVEAVSPVPFTDARALFLKDLAFGGASAASRPVLAQIVVKALLARADSVFQKYVGGLDHEPRAVAELVTIYAFIDQTIANAGKPTATTHDATAGIPAATYEDCSKALRDHVDKNARWLKGEGPLPESTGRVRAQAQVALADMLPDGVTRRVDAADRIGIKGARRQILTDWGILLADAGKVDEAKAEKIRQILQRLPGARVDLGLIYAGEDRGPLKARGTVAFVGGPGADAYPFPDEVSAGTHEAGTSAIALDLAYLAAKRALDNRGELRLQAERDAAAAQSDPGRLLGKPRAPSVDHVIAAAIHLLLTDAPRTVDLAFARLIGGRHESAAILSDAVGALAAFAETKDPKGGGPRVDLGKGTAATSMTAIRLAPNGTASGFTLEGHAWAVDRGPPSFLVTGATRDGQPLSMAHLATAKAPMKEGTSWTEAGYTFTKVRGAPRVALAPGADKTATVKMSATGGDGYDAISTPAPADDITIEGDLAVRGAPGGIAFRSAPTRKGVRAAALLVTPNGRTALVTMDDTNPEVNLAAPIDPSPAMPVHVKIVLAGTKIEATVGSTTLKGTLSEPFAHGDIALVGKRGASVDVAGFVVKKK
jgi:hypothetical protein